MNNLCARIFFGKRLPGIERPKVADEGKDFLRRGFDIYRSLNRERVRLGGGVDQYRPKQNGNNGGNKFERLYHVASPSASYLGEPAI